MHTDVTTNPETASESSRNARRGGTTRSRRAGHRVRGLVTIAAFVSTLGAALLASTGVSGATTTSDLPLPTTNQLVAMFGSPATLLVQMRAPTTLTWYAPKVKINKLVTFANSDPTAVADAAAGDYAAASTDLVEEFEKHPSKYLSRGAGHHVQDVFSSQGTAWAVTPNGYLVTNHHVVSFPTEFAFDTFTGSAGDPTALTQNVASTIVQQLSTISWGSSASLSLTDADKATTLSMATSWIDDASKVTYRPTVYVGGGQTVNDLNLDKAKGDFGRVAKVVKTSAGAYPSADIAILKIRATNLPVIPLGQDSTLQVGDPVHSLGYPAVASFESGTAPSAMVTATFTSGQVTNRIAEKGGFSAIEHTATINEGNSGGPLLDAKGQAIGINTAETSTSSGGSFFYAEPISLVEKYLKLAHVPLQHQQASADQATFDEAMQLMQQSHYKAALVDLNKVEKDGFDTPYIMMHTQMVRQSIAAGDDVPEPSLPMPLWLLISLITLAMGGVVVASVRVRRHYASGRMSESVPLAPAMKEPTAPQDKTTRTRTVKARIVKANSASDAVNPVAQLRGLSELKEAGVITTMDYDKKKAELLERI